MVMAYKSGHGHVVPRQDGFKARCGGPGFCPDCNNELGQLQSGQGQNYSGINGANAYGQSSLSDAQLQAAGAGRPIAEPQPKTLRDEFAMSALTGILSNTSYIKSLVDLKKGVLDECYEYADAAMKVREAQS